MAATRAIATYALRSSICRQCSKSLLRNAHSPAFSQSRRPTQVAIRPSFASIRWHSAPAGSPRTYDFGQVKSMSESPSSGRVIIDVREPAEYQAGYIPGAVNIPVKSQPDAIFLTDEEFEDRFGFEKPSPDKEVVFYCRSGVRSSAAAQLAQQHGYPNIAEYRGSWLDWEKNGGAIAKP